MSLDLASSLVSSTPHLVFTSDGRQDEELDTRKDKASAVMQALHYSVVMKRELSKKKKLSIFKTIFVPILTYDHEPWLMTGRVGSQVQAYDMRFLQTIEVILFNQVRGRAVQKKLSSGMFFSVELKRCVLVQK